MKIEGISKKGVAIDKLKIIRKPMIVDIDKLVYEQAIKDEIDSAYSQRILGRIYKASFAKGDFPIYILCNPSKILHIGNDIEIYLKKATNDEIQSYFNGDEKSNIILRRILKNRHLIDGKGYPKDYPSMMESLLNKHNEDPIFFIPTFPIARKELLQIEDLDDLIYQALDAGMDKDEKLIYIFRALIPIPVGDPSYIKPSLFMQSSPNTIFITTTKPGKTSTGRKIGDVGERPTVANLLGFSTAHEKTEGRLNRATFPFMADGIEEVEDEMMAMGLLNYMETGIADIPRGKGVKTKGYAPIIFSSNPSLGYIDTGWSDSILIDDEGRNLQMLDELLQRLHQNLLGFGSRIGNFVYDPVMKDANGEGISYFEEEALDKIILSIQEASRNAFTKLVLNKRVNRWISSIDDEIKEYQKRLDELLKDGNIRSFGKIYDFINGHKRAYRHIKGMALRASFMDHLKEILEIEDESISDSYIQMILNDANEHEKKVITFNLESFSNLSCTLKKEDIAKMIYENRYSSIRARGNVYEEFLLECATRWYLKQSNPDIGISIPLNDLRDEYLEIDLDKRRKSRYDTFNKFVEAIESNRKKINRHKGWLGLLVKKVEDVILITFNEKNEWFNWISEKIDLFKSMTESEMTEMTDDKAKTIGQIGQKSLGHQSLKAKIAGFKTIKIDHANWSFEFMKDHPDIPKEQFIREFIGKWGEGFKGDEIDKLYDVLKERLEK